MLKRKVIVGMVLAVFVSMGTTAWGTHYYVDPKGSDDANGLSWEDAFATIQKGLDTVPNGDIVEVKESTYRESVDFGGVAFTVISTDPNYWDIVETTIINASDASHGGHFHNSEGAGSRKDGQDLIHTLWGFVAMSKMSLCTACHVGLLLSEMAGQ